MRKPILAVIAATILGAVSGCDLAQGGPRGFFEVANVEQGDMLKMRAGPGTGFDVIAAFPNGTPLRIYGCDRTGGTRWCRASLNQSRSPTGYVSWAYLREI
ncbi:MAG: SH3 domain-containing protein [Rhodobacterales bacterium]|nr:SH3 domain-containing protein [Rhodobacterales bacterium]